MTETTRFAEAMEAQAAADEAAAFNELHALEQEAEQASRALGQQMIDRLAAIRQRKQAGARFDPDEIDDGAEPVVPPARSGGTTDDDEGIRRWLT